MWCVAASLAAAGAEGGSEQDDLVLVCACMCNVTCTCLSHISRMALPEHT